MILAPLADAARYHALHPRFPRAFAWLAEHGATIPDGRHKIDGDDLFAIVESGTTRDAAVARLESHLVYLDIQVNLLHGERMGWAPVQGLTFDDPFVEGRDIAFFKDRPHQDVLVAKDHFVIFYPEDGHMPLLHPAGQPVPYRKIVLKVRI